MKKTIATLPGESPIHVDLTTEEINQRDVDHRKHVAKKAISSVTKARENAYLEKGWAEPWDLMDDILDRGVSSVKTDRAAIKEANSYPGYVKEMSLFDKIKAGFSSLIS